MHHFVVFQMSNCILKLQKKKEPRICCHSFFPQRIDIDIHVDVLIKSFKKEIIVQQIFLFTTYWSILIQIILSTNAISFTWRIKF